MVGTLLVLALGWLVGEQQLKADLAAARDSLAKCATATHRISQSAPGASHQTHPVICHGSGDGSGSG